MKVIFVSSRGRGAEQNRTGEWESRTVQISVPCELVMGLLAQGGNSANADQPCSSEARFSKACPQA